MKHSTALFIFYIVEKAKDELMIGCNGKYVWGFNRVEVFDHFESQPQYFERRLSNVGMMLIYNSSHVTRHKVIIESVFWGGMPVRWKTIVKLY